MFGYFMSTCNRLRQALFAWTIYLADLESQLFLNNFAVKNFTGNNFNFE